MSKVRNKCVCAFNLSRKNVLSYESTKVLPKYFRTKVLPYFRARSRAVAASNDVKLRLDVVSTKVQSTLEGTFESTFVPSKVLNGSTKMDRIVRNGSTKVQHFAQNFRKLYPNEGKLLD